MAPVTKWLPLLSASIALLVVSAGSGCRPALVEVEGQVMMNGQPLPQAQIQTYPSNDRWPGASGMSDEKRHFQLTTFVDIGFQSGAFVGRHQVTVVVEEPGLGGFGVTARSPEEYASPNSSGITLDRHERATCAELENRNAGRVEIIHSRGATRLGCPCWRRLHRDSRIPTI